MLSGLLPGWVERSHSSCGKEGRALRPPAACGCPEEGPAKARLGGSLSKASAGRHRLSGKFSQRICSRLYQLWQNHHRAQVLGGRTSQPTGLVSLSPLPHIPSLSLHEAAGGLCVSVRTKWSEKRRARERPFLDADVFLALCENPSFEALLFQ